MTQIRFDGEASAQMIVERVLISRTVIQVHQSLRQNFRVCIFLNYGLINGTVVGQPRLIIQALPQLETFQSLLLMFFVKFELLSYVFRIKIALF